MGFRVDGGKIGIMENRMETPIICREYVGLYGGYIEIMENEMETIKIYREYIGLYEGYSGIMENIIGNYYNT